MIKIDKLFRDKKGTGVIYILLVVGIILLVMGNSLQKEALPQEEVYVYTSRTGEAEEILSQIKGAGRVSVMISGAEEEKNGLLGTKKEGNGESVLIVADGGGNSAVCEKLVRAASAALGVSAHKIEVFERK